MTWDPSDTGKRRGYHHGNLREALIEAALRLIGEKGPAGFTVAEAARAAAQPADIVWGGDLGRRVHAALPEAPCRADSQASLCSLKRARTASSATMSSASLAKASSRSDSASPRERPRVRR